MKPITLAFSSFLFTAIGIPLAIAAIAPNLAPFTAKHPGPRTLDNPGGPIPATAQAFAPFKETLGISWDDQFLYIEGNGLPAHDMMRGITAWQQQVPIPHNFTGDNRFKLPLNPTVLDQPQELTLLGPIALAVNGIPIFHSLTQSGKDAYLGGELDEWGGHCGRADDYHYHLAPAHLEELVGKGNPVAFGLDGHPVYLEDPSKDKPLDECHGYFDEEGNYRYVGNLKAPYMMAYFRGPADLEDRPRAQGVRPHLQPLRGAEITGFSGNLTDGYSLQYQVRGETHHINYQITESGADFEFTDADGSVNQESYERRAARAGGGKGEKGPGRPSGGKGGKKGKGEKGGKNRRDEPSANGASAVQSPRQPWLAVHASELDTNHDGIVDFEEELMDEADRVFAGYDRNDDGTIALSETASGPGVKSPLGGFVKQHAAELDRDGSGDISVEELTNQFRKFFERGDRNGDLRLTREEVDQMRIGAFPAKTKG